MTFERAQAIADAVLLEGYVLYPYRASSNKNRYRWTFGLVAPQSWSEASGSNPSAVGAQLLVQGERPSVRLRLRFLRVTPRQIEARQSLVFQAAEALDVDGSPLLPWEEGRLEELDFTHALQASASSHAHADPRAKATRALSWSLPEETTQEPVLDAAGTLIGRVVRSSRALQGRLLIHSEPLGETPSGEPLTRLSLRVENLTAGAPSGAPRAEIAPYSLASAHLMAALEGGAFVSLMDPPEALREAAAQCERTGLHPVLAGEPGDHNLVLCAPIILEDHPQIAPESTGDFFDASEIDELLVLRTLTLTEEEKTLARATDARSSQLVDRVEAMGEETLRRLHGRTTRESGCGLAPGSRVRLRPGKRRTDAQDLLYAGRTATVEAVMADVDGREHLAVTIDDDPAAELHRWYGRFHYYLVDEVEPLQEGKAG